MAELDRLLVEMATASDDLPRILTNLKKLGRSKFTVDVLQSRLNRLNAAWSTCQAIHMKIHCATTKEQQATLPYFTEDQYGTANEVYWEVSGFITTAITSRSPGNLAQVSHTGDVSIREGTRSNTPQLPRIPLPTFSGSYTDWVSFRDLFKSLVVANESLSHVEKLHYLKVSVEGEAKSLLKNITITDANFQVAWDALLNRYDQPRHIIDAQLGKLFDVPAVGSENVRESKQLRDQTSEAVNALKNLDRNVDTWDDILAFITVRKLDSVSRREWEMKISEKEDYPTYNEINTFLEYRVRALESISSHTSNNKSNKQNSNGKGNANSVKSHLSTASKCCECDGKHPIHKCEQFIVREKQLCSNCMASGHRAKQCPSRNSCFHYKKRHHTLLHLSDQQTVKKSEQQQISLPSGSAGTKLRQTKPVETSTPKLNKPDKQTAGTSVEALHMSKPQIASKSVMLATAWVRLTTENGRSIKVRALLDQGSQSSFLTESIAQILKAPRNRVHTTISGIGGTTVGTVHSSVTFTLSPCNNDKPSLQCDAFVFQKLTSYVPKGTIHNQKWTHLVNLELADPDPTSADPIQFILGAEMYAKVLRQGLRHGPAGSPLAQKTIFGWVLSGPIVTNTNEATTALSTHLAISDSNLSTEIRRFWELEEVPACSPLTEEENKCEAHFAATHRRLPEGRYCVKLPFKKLATGALGASSQTALKLMQKLEHKFTREPELHAQYSEFMKEYLDLGHMGLLIPQNPIPACSYRITP